MSPILVGGLVQAVGSVIDDLVTSDKERLDAEIELQRLGIEAQKIDAGLAQGQLDVNRVEASHENTFVSGWRPAVGWTCVAGLAYNFLAHPFLLWAWTLFQANGWVPMNLMPPPPVDVEALLVLLGGILGLGVYRTAEKVKGVSAKATSK